VRRRQVVAAVAGAALGIWLAARMPPRRIVNRWEFFERTRGFDLARRRLAGSSAAADRAFFVFLESARRALPAGTRGVALYAPGKSGTELYLAAYQFAPLPTRVAPAEVSPGWLAVFYGPPPPGWVVVRELPGGAIAAAPGARP